VFVNEEDYELIEQGDKLRIENLRSKLEKGKREFEAQIVNKGKVVKVAHNLTERQVKYILAGSRLNYVRESMG
jgi:aconitase A